MGTIHGKPNSRKRFPSIPLKKNNTFPKMHIDQSIKTRSIRNCNATICKWSIWRIISITITIWAEKYLWEWVITTWADTVHYFSWIRSQFWVTRICRDCCWKIMLLRTSHGRRIKWYCDWNREKCSSKR